MNRRLRYVGWFLVQMLQAGIWLSPVLPTEAFRYGAYWRHRGEPPDLLSPVELEEPTGLAPGHPECVSNAAPTSTERRLWADLGELAP
jgi:hypothetical protein